MEDVPRNITLALLSTGAYAATDLENPDMWRDSATFGVLNGLAQQFIPDIVSDPDVQKLFIDPVIASLAQGMVKAIFYQDYKLEQRTMIKAVVAGVASSALTLHIWDNKKKY